MEPAKARSSVTVGVIGGLLGITFCFFFWGGAILGNGFQFMVLVLGLFTTFCYCYWCWRRTRSNAHAVRLPISGAFSLPMLPFIASSPGEWVGWWVVVSFFVIAAAFLGLHAARLRVTREANAA
jgi:hypothetical protein